MSYQYDTYPTWPFPILPIIIHQPDGNLATTVLNAWLDTGADVTLVPASELELIESDEVYSAYLRMHWGESNEVAIHLVDLEIAGHLLPNVEVIADDYSNQVLLGRNVLNKLILLLDGPHQQTDILLRRPRF